AGSQRVQAGRHILTGQSFTQVFENLKPPFDFTAEDPLGRAIRLTPEFRASRVVLNLPALEQPGNYRLMQGSEPVGMVSVNPWPQESDFKAVADEALGELLPGLSVLPDAPGVLAEQVAKSRLGRELWPYLLAAALMLLLVEMAVARTGAARQASSQRQKEPVAQL
ncbi:MAG: hypothetical protein D6715_09235, partial [Calditrichaeota bacterium]